MPIIDRLMRTLRLKLLLGFGDGELKLRGVARSYRKGIEQIKRDVVKLAPLEQLAVLHTRRQAIAEKLADDLARLVQMPRGQIFVNETGAALSSHAGQGLIAAFCVTAK